MPTTGAWRAFVACLWVAALAACEEEQAEIVEPVRAIKTVTLTEIASGQVRKYSGIIEATDSSALSFQVSGQVQTVEAEQGNRVTQGQVLATLDTDQYDLNVQAARAELSRAKAALAEQQQGYQRQKTLYDKGWVAKAALDQAQAGFDSAQSQVAFASSQLNLAQRDLANTRLVAPFDGVIAERLIDPFVEVAAGQKAFELNVEGAVEVAFDVPETTIAQITLGMPVEVGFSAANSCECQGRITRIGTTAGEANAYPVRAALLDPPEGVLPGMTAEVSIVLSDPRQETAYLLPISALAPEGELPKGFVFVYDPATSTVRKTAVELRFAADNQVGAVEGVKAGDVIAVAGVSFLNDGQKVKLMAP